MGVAHRVESVLGSIEQQTLDSPGLVPAEIDAVRPGRGGLGGRPRGHGPEGCRRSWVTPRPRSSRATCRSSTTPRSCRRSTHLIENQQMTALSALQVGHEGLRRAIRADRAGVISASG